MVERPDTVPPILLSFPSPPHTFPASSFLEKRFPFLAYYSSTSSSSPRPRSPPITPFSASQPHARLISAFVIPPPFAKVCLSQALRRCTIGPRLVSQAYAAKVKGKAIKAVEPKHFPNLRNTHSIIHRLASS